MPPAPRPLPLYRTAALRRLEALAGDGAVPPLMERAGAAAFRWVRSGAGPARRKVLVVVGPGNNGGDGLVLARLLRQHGDEVVVVGDAPGAHYPADAALALRAWHDAGGSVVARAPAGWQPDLCVDALFGVGLSRPPEGEYAARIGLLNAAGAPVLALDVPSGLDADRGIAHRPTVRATVTLTFLALKPGLLTLDGPDHCGEVLLDTLGIDAAARVPADGLLLGADALRAQLPVRAANTHKGSYGTVGVLGAAPGMAGAGLLAARAALLCGAGRVLLGGLDPRLPGLLPGNPELMQCAPEALVADTGLACLVAGPGLGRSDHARSLLGAALASTVPLVLDADALNLLAADATLAAACHGRQAPTVLTPHPAEAARLAGTATTAIQADRIAAARALASRYGAAVVLKGAGTVVAHPQGPWQLNPSGNPGMAAAGMGDVLSGIIAALVAQQLPPAAAAGLGAWVHGRAGDLLARRLGGWIGLGAGEVAQMARTVLNTEVYAGTLPRHGLHDAAARDPASGGDLCTAAPAGPG